MPRSPLVPCTFPGCGAVSRTNRCAKHRVGAGRALQPRSDHWKFYNSPAWRAMSKRVLQEEPFCRDGCGRPSEVADHIVAITDGGARMDRANLQGMAWGCHSSKTQTEINNRRKARRAG